MGIGWLMIAACVQPPPDDADVDDGSSPPSPPTETGSTPTDTAPTTATTPTGDGSVTDVFVQETPAAVDVLFVIDDSGSMAEEQQSLIDSFSGFYDALFGSGVDYHLGVVSTDMSNPARSGNLREVGGDRWIDDQTANAEAVFGAMANVGTFGSGVEEGLGATFTALELLGDTANAGFLRDDSAVHVVVLSDEPDQTSASLITFNEFLDWYDNLRADPEDRTFSSIVTVSGPSRGTEYIDVTQAIGGVVHDITDRDYSALLVELGLRALGLVRVFTLSTAPDPSTLEVTVDLEDGATLAFAEGDDWTYDPAANTVTFLTYVPPANAVVSIHYAPAE